MNTATQFVICINNSDYAASLERHKVYRVIPDIDAAEDNDIRIIDESGEDYIYPAARFLPITLPDAVQCTFEQAA